MPLSAAPLKAVLPSLQRVMFCWALVFTATLPNSERLGSSAGRRQTGLSSRQWSGGRAGGQLRCIAPMPKRPTSPITIR